MKIVFSTRIIITKDEYVFSISCLSMPIYIDCESLRHVKLLLPFILNFQRPEDALLLAGLIHFLNIKDALKNIEFLVHEDRSSNYFYLSIILSALSLSILLIFCTLQIPYIAFYLLQLFS